jgi:molybdenum-dependent DNA-binding transcriptional regulator ModE
MQNKNDLNNVLDAIRQAVAQGDDIQNHVRDIVVEALAEVRMRPDDIQQILRESVQGASQGAMLLSGKEYEGLKQAIHGVDVALSHAAEASKLAIEEAVGNIQEFSDQDLHRAFDDITALEAMFLDTLADVAKGGAETVHKVLNEFMEHGKNTGTAVGNTLTESIMELQKLLTTNRKEKLNQTLDTAQAVSESVAGIASGLLAAMADKLQGKDKP